MTLPKLERKISDYLDGLKPDAIHGACAWIRLNHFVPFNIAFEALIRRHQAAKATNSCFEELKIFLEFPYLFMCIQCPNIDVFDIWHDLWSRGVHEFIHSNHAFVATNRENLKIMVDVLYQLRQYRYARDAFLTFLQSDGFLAKLKELCIHAISRSHPYSRMSNVLLDRMHTNVVNSLELQRRPSSKLEKLWGFLELKGIGKQHTHYFDLLISVLDQCFTLPEWNHVRIDENPIAHTETDVEFVLELDKRILQTLETEISMQSRILKDTIICKYLRYVFGRFDDCFNNLHFPREHLSQLCNTVWHKPVLYPMSATFLYDSKYHNSQTLEISSDLFGDDETNFYMICSLLPFNTDDSQIYDVLELTLTTTMKSTYVRERDRLSLVHFSVKYLLNTTSRDDYYWNILHLVLSQPLEVLRKAGTDFSDLVSSMFRVHYFSEMPFHVLVKGLPSRRLPSSMLCLFPGYHHSDTARFECLSSIKLKLLCACEHLPGVCKGVSDEHFTDKEFFQFCRIIQNDMECAKFLPVVRYSQEFWSLYKAVVGHIRARIVGFALGSGGIFFAHSVIQLADALSAPDGSSLRLMAVFCTILMASSGRANCETIGEALDYVAKHLPSDSVVDMALAYYEKYKQGEGQNETQAMSSDFSDIDPTPAYLRLNVNNRHVMDKNAIETWLNSSATSEWRRSENLPHGYFKCPMTGVKTNIEDCSVVLDVPKFDGLRGVALYLQQEIGTMTDLVLTEKAKNAEMRVVPHRASKRRLEDPEDEDLR